MITSTKPRSGPSLGGWPECQQAGGPLASTTMREHRKMRCALEGVEWRRLSSIQSLCRLQRSQVADQLPELLVGKFRPRRHAPTQIAVRQQPMQVAFAGFGLNTLGTQRRPLVNSLCAVTVALRAVIGKKQPPSRDRLRLVVIRVCLLPFARRHLRQPVCSDHGCEYGC